MFDGDTLSTSPAESGGTATGSSSSEGEAPTVGVILDATSFYAEAGGQAADCGTISIVSPPGDGGGAVKGVIEVADVRMFGGFALHVGRLVSGRWVGGDWSCLRGGEEAKGGRKGEGEGIVGALYIR